MPSDDLENKGLQQRQFLHCPPTSVGLPHRLALARSRDPEWAKLLVSMAMSDERRPVLQAHRRSGFWIRGGSRAFARISSRTLGRYVVVTNPAPPRCRSNGFQRASVALQTTPGRAETAERATWGTKTPPRPPTAGTPPAPARGSCAAETTALGPTGAHLGGLPGGGAPAAGALNRVRIPRAVPSPPHSTREKTQPHRTRWGSASACRTTKIIKKAPELFYSPPSLSSQFEHIAATVVASGGVLPRPRLAQCLV
jgi:hypothetical protein